MSNISYRVKGLLALLALFTISLFIFLGFWQLRRAEEKKNMLYAAENYSKQSPLHWAPGMKQPIQYQIAAVTGHYLPFTLLLDNQYYKHALGYHVLSPLVLSTHQIVLVDRGWVKSGESRQDLPTIHVSGNKETILGQVYYPSSKNWILGPVLEKKTDQLAVIEKVDIPVISHFLHKSFYPFIIRLDKGAKDGFVREWSIISLSPQRHKAYAFQWFAMAVAVLIIYIGLTIKKNEKN